MESENKESHEIKEVIMSRIRERRIKMRSPLVFLAKKLGLESFLLFDIIAASFLVSLTLLFLKKTGLLKFLSLGYPGVKVFVFSMPYAYILLLIFSILIAAYAFKKIGIDSSRDFTLTQVSFFVFSVAVLTGASIVFFNFGDSLARSLNVKHQLPKDMAIYGRIMTRGEKEFLIEDEDGRLIRVIWQAPMPVPPQMNGEISGKYLRAMGKMDSENETYFRAEQIICCDND
jgi:hypothetical protein